METSLDGSASRRDELEALATIAGPVARAVWIVRARVEHDAELERRTRVEMEALRTGVVSPIS
ncbi:MAG TPA: hypothetical protein VFS20_08995 [Longimicrobium sp.]|nr:hypothetical protein [Longimicrobium sp.]